MNIGQVQIPDFAGSLMRGEQAQASRLQMLAMQQDMADQQGLRAAAAQPGLMDGSNASALSGLLQYGPRGVQLAQTIQQRADQQRGAMREQLPLIGSMLEGATPETWGEVRARAQAAGINPSLLPEAFDPGRVANLARAAQAVRQAAVQSEVDKFNATLPGRIQVAGAGRTSVNVRLPPMENSFAQGVGTSLAQEASELPAAARRSADNLRMLERFERGLAAFDTGAAANARVTVGRALQQLGVPDSLIPQGINRDAIASAETMSSVSSQLLAGMIGPGGFPAQNFSNADREMLERALPNIANTPGGNRMLLTALRSGAQRNLEVAEAWRQWQQQNGVTAESYLRFQRERLPQITERDVIAPLMANANQQQQPPRAPSLLDGAQPPAAPVPPQWQNIPPPPGGGRIIFPGQR